MNRYTVIWPCGEVHAEGCEEVHRILANGMSKIMRSGASVTQTIEAESVGACLDIVCDEMNADFGEGAWSHADFHAAPCAYGHAHKKPVARVLPPGVCPGTGKPFKPNKAGRRYAEGNMKSLYWPCPVCGRAVGTGRGVAPRHKG